MDVSIEYMRFLVEELAKIKRAPLDSIVFYENGKIVSVLPETVSAWEYTGLNNVDFIMSGYYLTTHHV